MGSSGSIYQKAIKGGQFTFLGKIVQEVLVAVQLIVLARILAPRDFGLMGIVLLSISVINLFTRPGLQDAFIQTDEHEKDDLSVIWTFGLVRATVLFLLVFLLSPLIAAFFDNDGQFKTNHFVKPQQIISRLKDTNSQSTQFVYSHLSEETQKSIQVYASGSDVAREMQKTLASDLNTLILIPDFYQNNVFDDIIGEAAFQELVQSFPDQYPKINRLLLETLFDTEIRKIIFARQDVCLALRILGLSFIIGALGNIGPLLYRRSLEFKFHVAWRTLNTFLSVVIIISFTVILKNFWALVYGRLISSTITTVLSYRIHPFRPTLIFSFKVLKRYWGFGKHILKSSILRFFILEGDDIFVGKMLGPVTLGFYRYAYKFANMVATQVGDVISQVTFPTLSRLQDDIPKMRSGYIKSIQCLSLIIYPISGGLFILAEDFVSIVLGDQWLSIVPTMRILCLLGVSRCLQVGSLVRALGRPDISFKVLACRLALIVVSIYPLTSKFGLPGTAMSVTFSTIVMVPLLLNYVRTLIGHSIFDYVKLISLPALSTLIMVMVLHVIRSMIVSKSIFIFMLLVFVGTIVYSFFVLAFQLLYKEYNVIPLIKELITRQR